MSNASIAVIISTYNGQDHIREQIDSILSQTVQPSLIFVRDDGSSDDTISILEQYGDKITFEAASNVGVAQSFLMGLSKAYGKADYYAFCDQDDVWLPNKLEMALEKLEQAGSNDTPLLYHSEYLYCDKCLSVSGPSTLNKRGVTTSMLLYDCPTSGNTIVFNSSLAQLVLSRPTDGAYYHDWYVALIASIGGRLVYDDRPSLLYRRLDESITAGGMSGVALLKYRIEKFIHGDGLKQVQKQVEHVNKYYKDEMDASTEDLFSTFCAPGRIKHAFAPFPLRQTKKDEVLLRLLFLSGRI